MSIGELIEALRPDFPDVSISKIRYLEAEGLIEPSRTPAGYRRFTHSDIARLRYVLTAQRDQYLPLRVIKDNLAAMDRGKVPSGYPGRGGVLRLAPSAEPLDDELTDDPDDVVRLTRAELLDQAGIESGLLDELESFGFISRRMGPAPYDRDALMVASLVRELGAYGLEPRHLRAVRTAADREIGLVQQVVTPLLRRGGPDARARAEDAARELASLSVRLHAALVMAGLRR